MQRIVISAYCIFAAGMLVLSVVNQKITRTVQSASGVAYDQKVDSVAYGCQLEQKFTPQYERLNTLRIYVDTLACSKEEGVLQISMMEEDTNNIFCYQIPIAKLPQYGWVDIPLHLRLLCDQTYAIVLESIDCIDFGPKILFYDAKLAATKEQQGYNLIYAGMEVPNAALRVIFDYDVPIETYEYFGYYIFGLVVVSIVFGDTNGVNKNL